MNKKIYIVDLIGSFAGMDYYDTSLANQINKNPYQIKILSNFSLNNDKPFFEQIFGKNKIYSLITMMWIYTKLFYHIIFHRKATYIFMTYGEIYDFIFFTLNIFNRHFFLDIHEVYSARYYEKKSIKNIFGWYYKHLINNVIYHSDKTKTILEDFGYRGNKLFVPHFKYSINQNYDKNQLGDDVRQSFCSNKIKMLFFGNLRKVKGVDIVVSFFEKHNVTDKVELVIAGRNVENIDFSNLVETYHIIDRHINDDELKYLYSHADYVLLPYRDSSQSGVLEMAFTFRTPMLMSDIPYFNGINNDYSSFGYISPLEQYDNLLFSVINEPKDKGCYYTTTDCEKFLMKEEIEKFKKSFFEIISRH